MKKQYYDHKCVLCESCVFHRPEGERETNMGRIFFKESCGRYGYIFHEYPEDADACDGYQTPEGYELEQKMKSRLKQRRK